MIEDLNKTDRGKVRLERFQSKCDRAFEDAVLKEASEDPGLRGQQEAHAEVLIRIEHQHGGEASDIRRCHHDVVDDDRQDKSAALHGDRTPITFDDLPQTPARSPPRPKT